MLSTISSCSICCRVFPCRRGEGAKGDFTKATVFGVACEFGAGRGFGAVTGTAESKNEKSADAQGSLWLVAEFTRDNGTWVAGDGGADAGTNVANGPAFDSKFNKVPEMGAMIPS